MSAAPPALVEHFFRHEAGRLQARLTRRFGAARLEEVEDAIQIALERALGNWAKRGIPENPAAWLTRVATNDLLDRIRRQQTAAQFESDLPPAASSQLHDADEDGLVLLFACADESLSPRARLILCLKLLSGFSTGEIAERLFMKPAGVQKTLERGRERLKEIWAQETSSPITEESQRARLDTVQLVLYLQFNEGYSFGADDDGLRAELCNEAIRLTRLLALHPVGNVPSTWALLSLMHLNASRLPARVDGEGELVPLADQDRGLWDRNEIALGLEAFRSATTEDSFSRFHGEALIQIEHAIAPSFEETQWLEIADLYDTLSRAHPAPTYVLNRALALAEAKGPRLGLDTLDAFEFPPWFEENYLYQAAKGDLYRRLGNWREAQLHFATALEKTTSRIEKKFFEKRIQESQSSA